MEARLSRWLGRGMAVWLVFGVVINLSLACIALLPIEAMALMLLWRPQWRRVPVLATMAGAGIFVLLAALFWPGANDLSAGGGLAGLSRRDFLVNGLHILRDFAPLGTGLGSFTQIYRWYENPALAGLTFVNHAHDDWLELLIEGGVLAVMPLVAFFAWLRARWLAEWRHGGAVRQVAPLCIAIEMAHSLVDYPLRTAALAGLFAVCCAMID